MNLHVKNFRCKKSKTMNWSVFDDRGFDLSEVIVAAQSRIGALTEQDCCYDSL